MEKLNCDNKQTNKKPIVLFPAVEAGMGHIMPMRSISEVFCEKYGEHCEVIRTNFYSDSNSERLKKLEKVFVKEVMKHNKYKFYGTMSINSLHFFGIRLSKWFVMKLICGKKTFNESIELMNSFNADVVFSTHWATAILAEALTKNANNQEAINNKFFSISYVPDVSMNAWVTKSSDMFLLNTEGGIEEAVNKIGVARDKTRLVPRLLRKEVFSTPSKAECRRIFGFSEDEFVVVLADGGYGAGKMGKVTRELIRSNEKITVVPVCGKNHKLYEELKTLQPNPCVTLRPYGFCEDLPSLINCADVFSGKAGASTMAEPCYFGVPIVITMYATPIEKWNGSYYIDELGCALKCFNPKKAARLILELKNDPKRREMMSENTKKARSSFGAEVSADIIWEVLCNKFPHLKDIEIGK